MFFGIDNMEVSAYKKRRFEDLQAKIRIIVVATDNRLVVVVEILLQQARLAAHFKRENKMPSIFSLVGSV